MAFSQLRKDMAIIQKLDDEPNDVGGLTAQELKAKFDEAGETIKAFLNDTLLPELGGNAAADEIGAVLNGEEMTVQGALDLLRRASIQSGNVPMGGGAGDVLQKRSDELYDLEWRPLLTRIAFAASDWVKDGELYTIIIPQTEHLRRNGDFGCALRHLVDGAPVSNTWATLGTQTSYDSATGDVTLTTADAYDGTALFYGGQEYGAEDGAE